MIQAPEIWFYKPQGIVGSLVTFFTRGIYSHCGFVHEIEGVRVFTDAHAARGVSCRPVRLLPLYDFCVSLDSIDHAWLNRSLATRWGLPYGFRDALGFVIGGSKDHKGIICSELIIEVLTDAIRDGKSVKNAEALQRLLPAKTSPDLLQQTLVATS